MTQLIETAPRVRAHAEQGAPMADLGRAMDYAGNHPAKLVTILALSTFEPGEFVRYGEVANRVGKLQGDQIGWAFRPSVPDGYCRSSLAPLGFVELGDRKGIRTVRLTELGRTAGMTLAGAVLPLAYSAPEGQSIQEVLGRIPAYAADGQQELTRLTIFRELSMRPEGMAMAELQAARHLKQSTTSPLIQELCRIGLLKSTDRHDPAARLFAIGEPPRTLLRTLGPETRAALSAAIALRHEGIKQATGSEILARVQYAEPLSAWSALLGWLRKKDRAETFITELSRPENTLYRTQVKITEAWQPLVQQLLRIRSLLSADSPEAQTFRTHALQWAGYLATAPEARKIVSDILSRARQDSRFIATQRTADWLPLAQNFVPPEGIYTARLHKKITQQLEREVSYQTFRRRLGSAPSLVITKRPRSGRSGALLSYVNLQQVRFGRNWRTEAVCRAPGINPEDFYPPGTEGSSVMQAEKAKRICQGCPVQLACLKTALQTHERYGVWGGVWLENPKPEVTPQRRAQVLAQVILTNSR